LPETRPSPSHEQHRSTTRCAPAPALRRKPWDLLTDSHPATSESRLRKLRKIPFGKKRSRPYGHQLVSLRIRSGSRLSWGLTPSSRQKLRESTWLPGTIAHPGPARAPPRSTLRSALRLSQPRGGLLLPRPCGLVSCHCHVQGLSLQGLSLQGSLTRLVVKPCPHAVTGSPARTKRPKPSSPFDEQDRLQGFAPPRSPFPWVRCYSFPGADPLMGFPILSRVLPPPAVQPRLATRPLRSCPWVLQARSPLAAAQPESCLADNGSQSWQTWTPAYCRAGGLGPGFFREPG
jgi:hypothetical protein